ncbi:MAG TPA: hypothetical protein VF155_09025 [Candidatus Dormibacteraeota bacterium]
MTESGVGQPADLMPDRCPYSRPFPEGFTDCPTFQAQQFVAATTQEQPLGVHLSCVHLRVGELARNRYYAQCALGTAADRRAWLQQVGERRVVMMRQMQSDFAELYGDRTEELMAAKAATISAPDDQAAAAKLDRLLTEVTASLDDFMVSRTAQLEEIGFPVDSLRELLEGVLERWRESPRMGTPPIEAERLSGIAPELRSFLGGSPREGQQATSAH